MYYNKLGEKIVYCSLNRANQFLYIPMAGVTYPNANYFITHNISKFTHWDRYNFEYVTKGVGYIETPNKRYTVRAGDLYFLNRLQHHIYYPDKDNPFEKMFVVVKGEFLDALLTAYQIHESVIIRQVNVEYIFQRIHELLENGEELDYDEISVLLLQLVQKIHSLDYEEDSGLLSLAERIKSYIDDNITEMITLDKLVKALNISKSHIERVYKEEFNQTPIKYAIRRKLELSAGLLITTNFPISAISAYFAFNDPKYFSKCFSAHFGMSPAQYRKLNSKNTNGFKR